MVTGASSHIGLETSRRLACKGARLALPARNEEGLAAIRAGLRVVR